MIIDQNLSTLKSIDLGSECRGVSIRQEGSNFVRYMNLMVSANTGEIYKISKKVFDFPDMLVAIVAVETPVDAELGKEPKMHLKLLGSIAGELPEKVSSIVESSFEKFNDSTR